MTIGISAAHCLRVVLVEPLPEVGVPLFSMLRDDGFAHTRHVCRVDQAYPLLAEQDVDLLIIDLDVQREEALSLTRDIRHAREGYDPFIGIIGIETAVTLQEAKEYRSAGFDHIIVKPFSTRALIDHLLELGRKPRAFLYTNTYAGPDRRDKVRNPSTHVAIEVPNRFRRLVEDFDFDNALYEEKAKIWRESMARETPADIRRGLDRLL
jgi:two-component system chemotaxis response regulator CheY